MEPPTPLHLQTDPPELWQEPPEIYAKLVRSPEQPVASGALHLLEASSCHGLQNRERPNTKRGSSESRDTTCDISPYLTFSGYPQLRRCKTVEHVMME